MLMDMSDGLQAAFSNCRVSGFLGCLVQDWAESTDALGLGNRSYWPDLLEVVWPGVRLPTKDL